MLLKPVTESTCTTMELFGRRKLRLVSAQDVSCRAYDEPPNVMQYMHGNIPYMFDCWADPVVHLLLLKNSTTPSSSSSSFPSPQRSPSSTPRSRRRAKAIFNFFSGQSRLCPQVKKLRLGLSCLSVVLLFLLLLFNLV